jgi:hypothetical protein
VRRLYTLEDTNMRRRIGKTMNALDRRAVDAALQVADARRQREQALRDAVKSGDRGTIVRTAQEFCGQCEKPNSKNAA